jgi:hypothetical protein
VSSTDRDQDTGWTDRHPADEPPADEPSADEPQSEDRAPGHPDLQAELRERADGANAEQITDEANLRANPDPPE